MQRFWRLGLSCFLLVSPTTFFASSYNTEQNFRSAMAAFKDRNFYSARLLLQEIILQDARGEYGDDAQYYLAMTYFYEADYKSAQFEFKALDRDFPDSPFLVRAAFWTGEAWFYQKKYREAIETHSAFVRKYRENPLSASALYTIGFIYNEQGRFDEAAQEFERALKDYPETSIAPALTLELGIARLNAKEFVKARQQFENLLVNFANAGNLDSAKFWLGKSYFAEENFAEALKEFDSLEKDFVNSKHVPESLYLAALCEYKLKHFARAEDLLQKAAKEHPKDVIYPFVKLREGQLFHEQNQDAKALPALLDIINNFRNHETFAPALELLATIRVNEGKSEEAIKLFEALENEEGVSDESTKHLVRQHADLLFKEARYQAAAEKYAVLTKKFSKAKEAHQFFLLRARAEFEAGKKKEALSTLDTLEENYHDKSSLSESLFLRAEIEYQLGNFKKALQLYARFTKKYPKHARTFSAEMGIGWTYFELKQFARAADYFKKILKNHKEDSSQSKALLALGACQYNLRAFEAAEKSYKTIINFFASEKVEYAEALYQLAWLEFRRNRFTDAAKLFEKYIALGISAPRSAEARYFLAQTFLKEGESAKAEEILSRLVEDSHIPDWLKEKSLGDLAKTQALGQNFSSARSTYVRLLKEYPDTSLKEESYYQIASLSLKLTDEKTALEATQSLRSFQTRLWLDEALSELSEFYRKQKEWKKAADALREVEKHKTKAPEKLSVSLRRATLLIEEGKKSEAIGLLHAILENADATEETILSAMQSLFSLYEADGHFKEGAQEAASLTKRYAETANIRLEAAFSEARFHYLAQNYAAAREILLPLTKQRTLAERAKLSLGETYLKEGNTAQALDYFRQISSAQDDPSWLKARFYIGTIQMEQKNFEEAAREFARVAYAENKDATLYEKSLYQAALAFKALKKTKEYETFREKLKAAFPQSLFIKELN